MVQYGTVEVTNMIRSTIFLGLLHWPHPMLMGPGLSASSVSMVEKMLRSPCGQQIDEEEQGKLPLFNYKERYDNRISRWTKVSLSKLSH